MADLIGRTIGNYVVQKEVGRGGMGAVYIAEHPRIHRRVAVKVLHGDASGDPEMVARFFNEARAASDIRDAHIVEILDFGELPEGTSYLVMEWLDGHSLGAILDSEGRLGLARAAHILGGVGRALSAAHAHGVIHRDLKPDNVFLVLRDGDPDFVKVLDFGIAKLLAPGDGPSPRTRTNTVMGTPAYMSPEQCRGESSTLDARSDIYSLGVMLYEMVTGRRPFLSETYTGVLVAHITQTPPPPRSIDPSLPEAVEHVILRALEKDRERRFAHVQEFVEEFAAAAGTGSGPVVASAGPLNVRGATAVGLGVPAALSSSSASSPGMAAARSPTPPRSGVSGPITPTPPRANVSTPPRSGVSGPITPTPPRANVSTPPRSGVSDPITPAPSAGTRQGVAVAPIAPAVDAEEEPVSIDAVSGARPAPREVHPTDAIRRPKKGTPWWAVAIAGAGALALGLVGALALMRDRHEPPAKPVNPPPIAAPAPPIAAPAPPIAAAASPGAVPIVAATQKEIAATQKDSAAVRESLPAPRALAATQKEVAASQKGGPAPRVEAAPRGTPSIAPVTAKRTASHEAASAGANSRVAAVLDPYGEPPPAPRREPPPPPRAAPVEERGGDELDRRLASEAAQIAPGARRHGAKLRGAGGEGQGQDRFVPLEGGHCYTFVSVGAPSMPQLYTYLWDPTGKRLATDRSESTTSTFSVCAPMTGQYKFQAKPAHGPGEFRTAIYETQ